MIGSITPLVQEALITRKWLWSASAYTTGSVMAAVLVGAALGALGQAIDWARNGWPLVLGTAIVVALMEFGLVPRPWPLVQRQTKMHLRMTTGSARAAFWWGVDIGNGLTTAANYHTLWIFVLAAIALSDPVASLALYASYGFGRAGIVWSGPLLRRAASRRNIELIPALMRRDGPWHRLHAWIAVAAIVVVVTRF